MATTPGTTRGTSHAAERDGRFDRDAGARRTPSGILTVGYMISRRLAKAGSRNPYWNDGRDG